MRFFCSTLIFFTVSCSGSATLFDAGVEQPDATETDAANSDAGADTGATDTAAADADPLDEGPLDTGPTVPEPQEFTNVLWEDLPNAPVINGKQDDVFFWDSNLGWSVNGLGRIYRTTDGGDTWDLVLQQSGTYFRAILFVSPLRGFAGTLGMGLAPSVTDATPLYETRDGGDTWTAVTAITGPMPAGICNMEQRGDTVLAVGRVAGPSFVMRSDDLGETWTSTDLTAQIPMLIDAELFSATEGLLVGGSSNNPNFSRTVVFRTDDGSTWSEVFSSTTSRELAWKIDFPTEDTGFVSVQSSGPQSSLLKTTDRGLTWQVLPFISGPYNAKGVGFATENVGWVAGEAPGTPAYRTLDGGQTWTEDPSLGPLVNRFRFLEQGRLGFAIGQRIQKLRVGL